MSKIKSIYMNFEVFRKFKRHFAIQFKYLTFSKLLNIFIAAISYLLCTKKVRSKPFLLKVEPSFSCNLRCLGCRTGTTTQFKNEQMPLERYQAIIDELKDSLIEVVLYLWGEPFINKNLVKMISYASSRNIGTVISTNMHFLSKETAQGLVENKLDKLIVCIDGLDQETYERIRTGGNLSLVMKNLNTLLDVRKEAHSRYPLIEWQFIRTKFNEHQIEPAKQLAEQMGIDVFTVMEDLSGRREPNTQAKSKKKTLFEKRCPWLWFALAVQCDGSIYPCCHFANDTKHRFDVVDNVSLKEVWNSQPFIVSRKRFADASAKGDTICFRCYHYKNENTDMQNQHTKALDEKHS